MAVDTFTISVPGDLYGDSTTIKELGQAAIDEAREEADTFVMPCEWTARHVSGEVGDFEVTFEVTRRPLK